MDMRDMEARLPPWLRAGLAGLARRAPRSRWARLSLGALLSVAFTEALLRVAFWLVLHLGTPPNCGVRPELLGRLVYAYSHDRGSPSSPEQDGMLPDPHRGYRHAPGLRQRVLHGAPMSTNSRGLRGEREYSVPRPPGGLRIVALGDSFTFGEGVGDDETWPAQLEAALPGTEVANLGERAFAHDQMYFALADDGLPLQPDAVILGFYEHDLARDELSFYCFEKPRFSPGPGGWQIENVPVPPPWEVHDRHRRMPLLYAFPRVLYEAYREPLASARGGEARATEILRRMRQLVEASGARFLVVDVPDKPGGPAEPGGFFHDYCARTGAECVDPGPLFRAAGGSPADLMARFRRPHDIHYSREGYAVVAEALRLHLAERPLARASRPTP
jgi:hypothetical protein